MNARSHMRRLAEHVPLAGLARVPASVRRRAHRALLTRRELERLARSPHPAGTRLAQALRAVVDDAPSGEEHAWADRIEALRRDLLASTEQLQVIDYGAGKPGRHASPDATYGGRVVQSRVDEICRTTSAPPRWALLLLELARAFRPVSAVELGTSLGVSTAYVAAALELNGAGRLVTLEGAGAVAEHAERNIAQLGLDDRVEIVVGRFQDTLGSVLECAGPVDYAFIDGHHDGAATLGYFEQLLPSLSDGALLVFDDVSWSAGMARAWKRIQNDARVSVSVDLFQAGLCIVGGPRFVRSRFAVAIDATPWPPLASRRSG